MNILCDLDDTRIVYITTAAANFLTKIDIAIGATGGGFVRGRVGDLPAAATVAITRALRENRIAKSRELARSLSDSFATQA
jgi:ribosomal protein S9